MKPLIIPALLLLLIKTPFLHAQISHQIDGNARMSTQENQRVVSVIKESAAKTYMKRGLARSSASEWDGAISDFNKVIKIEPLNAVAYFNRGNAQQARGEHNRAIADYDKAISINPRLAEAYNNRGVARQRNGDTAGALADYEKAIENDPQNALAYANRGLTRLFLGQEKDATKDFEQCKMLGNKLGESLEKRIQELQRRLMSQQ
jgi:tetratricopeptide (TPR) repeat protein